MSTGKKRLLAYIIMVISVMMSIRLVKDIIKLSRTDDRISEAEQDLLNAKQEQFLLEQNLKEIETGEWWETQVRNKLKMAKPNEEIVIIPEEVIKTADLEVMDLLDDERELSSIRKWQELFFY